jgi:SAM-dependent methyltransferase
MATDEVAAQIKQGQRASWAAGDWDKVSALITMVGPDVLDHIGLEPDMDLLDVGTGTGGTVAIPAAQRGARVVGSDLTPEHFDRARERAAEAGVDVDWVEADAEALPFEDASFDRVPSTFGHMFAPRHDVAAAELARVCRPGGVIGTTTWLTDSLPGRMFKIVGGHMPPPPPGVGGPMQWGDRDHVRAMLEPHGLEVSFDEGLSPAEFDDLETAWSFYEDNFGGIVLAKQHMGDAYGPLRDDLQGMLAESEQDDGSVRLESRYLITIARRPG